MSSVTPDSKSYTDPEVRSEALEKSTIRAVSIRVLPIMFLLYFFAFVDRASLGFAQLHMGTELSIDPAIFGLAASAFFVGYILLEIPSSVLLDKFGARIWMTRIGVSWGIVTILTGFVQNHTQLIVARVLLGVAEAGLAAGIYLFTMKLYPMRHRAKATALILLGAPIAGALTGPISGVILDHADWFGISSWRWIFILTGIPPLLLGIVTYKWLTDRPSEMPWLTDEQRSWLVAAVEADPTTSAHKGNPIVAALRNRTVLLLGLVQFLTASATYGLVYWTPQIMKGLAGNVSATTLGLLVFVPAACGAVMMYVNGWHSDRTGERLFHTTFCQIVAASSLLLLPLAAAHSYSLAFLLLILATAAIYAFAPSFWAIPQKIFNGPRAATLIASVTTIGQLSGLLSPYIFGLFTKSTGNTNAGVIYLGAGVLVAAALLLAFRRRWQVVA
ncbi:MFS transporter [Rhodococcus pseudokoreensis]|uniref:MFS transporter n=1 Tax=Rhodococcus pseudokoreensis TaxID=2811421 RepID=A0A974ZUH7_9NOCA|nr:MFS transporter [Rhodococcus pseudokoreensis]QSE90804.1 MFS transporter [Rhodococcus pseudokoreensis]